MEKEKRLSGYDALLDLQDALWDISPYNGTAQITNEFYKHYLYTSKIHKEFIENKIKEEYDGITLYIGRCNFGLWQSDEYDRCIVYVDSQHLTEEDFD
jgi:hypothetical protein